MTKLTNQSVSYWKTGVCHSRLFLRDSDVQRRLSMATVRGKQKHDRQTNCSMTTTETSALDREQDINDLNCWFRAFHDGPLRWRWNSLVFRVDGAIFDVINSLWICMQNGQTIKGSKLLLLLRLPVKWHWPVLWRILHRSFSQIIYRFWVFQSGNKSVHRCGESVCDRTSESVGRQLVKSPKE